MAHRLRVTDGPVKGAVFGLRSAVILGRANDIDIQLLDRGVSRRHACIVLDDTGQMVLMDLSSKNGTFMGGHKIGSHVLQQGDTFRVGETEFVYEEVDGEPNDTIPVSAKERVDLGDAEIDTQVTRLPLDDASGPACTDPLHLMASQQGWTFCPACGSQLDG